MTMLRGSFCVLCRCREFRSRRKRIVARASSPRSPWRCGFGFSEFFSPPPVIPGGYVPSHPCRWAHFVFSADAGNFARVGNGLSRVLLRRGLHAAAVSVSPNFPPGTCHPPMTMLRGSFNGSTPGLGFCSRRSRAVCSCFVHERKSSIIIIRIWTECITAISGLSGKSLRLLRK